MAKLSVNVNKIATLRNTRALDIPCVVRCATLCLDAGAAGITIHPRPDERHIRPADVDDLAALLKRYPHAEFNIEGNPLEGQWMNHIRRAKPTQCTLVPDSPEQSTSDHGWDLRPHSDRLRAVIEEMKSLGCRVSLFMDYDSDEWAIAKALGADRVELYTEPYATGFAKEQHQIVKLYSNAARRAREVGLEINAGHDLNLHNLAHFINNVPDVAEVSIGHALIADALQFGLTETVQRYIAAAKGGRG